MVQIIEENRKPSFGENFSKAIGGAIQGYGQFKDHQNSQEMNRKANELASQLLGFDPSGLDPQTRNQLVMESFKQQGAENLQSNKFKNEAESLRGEHDLDNESYNTLQDAFGKKFADIWRSSPTGARTEMLKGALDAKARGYDIDEMLSNNGVSENSDEIIIPDLSKKPVGLKISEWTKEKRKEINEVNKPILKEIGELRKNIPLQEQSIQDIKDAAPGVGWQDYIADKYNFEPLRTESGVKLKTAVKDFFLSDLSRAGARPNQWIEQQLATALPAIGRDPQANLITAAGLEFKVDLAKKRAELIDELSEKYGNSSIDLGRTANKMMKSYVTERQKILENQIKSIKAANKEQEQTLSGRMIDVQGPDGQIYEVDEGEIGQLPEGYLVI
jgi:hypothetical protein